MGEHRKKKGDGVPRRRKGIIAALSGGRRSMRRKRHSAPEIIAKLKQAEQMIAVGTPQSDIARKLGVSAMTYYRWRNAQSARGEPRLAESRDHNLKVHITKREQSARMDELQLENSRLRRLVADLLLEKVKLEEYTRGGKSSGAGPRAA